MLPSHYVVYYPKSQECSVETKERLHSHPPDILDLLAANEREIMVGVMYEDVLYDGLIVTADDKTTCDSVYNYCVQLLRKKNSICDALDFIPRLPDQTKRLRIPNIEKVTTDVEMECEPTKKLSKTKPDMPAPTIEKLAPFSDRSRSLTEPANASSQAGSVTEPVHASSQAGSVTAPVHASSQVDKPVENVPTGASPVVLLSPARDLIVSR